MGKPVHSFSLYLWVIGCLPGSTAFAPPHCACTDLIFVKVHLWSHQSQRGLCRFQEPFFERLHPILTRSFSGPRAVLSSAIFPARRHPDPPFSEPYSSNPWSWLGPWCLRRPCSLWTALLIFQVECQTIPFISPVIQIIELACQLLLRFLWHPSCVFVLQNLPHLHLHRYC